MDVALALIAALLFSLGTVLQQQVAASVPSAEGSDARFVLGLARRPRWLAGQAADALGYAFQAGALAAGRLVVVQPLLATTVVFALPLGAKLGGRRVSKRNLAAAVAVTAGLATFLVVANPAGGRSDASATAWIVSFAVCAALCGALVLVARGRTRGARAGLLGAAAGIVYGLTAALTKATVERLDDGVLSVFADWHVYSLLVVGYASVVLSQRSLQTGVLAPAVATQTSINPVASLFLGTLAFDEAIHESAAGVVGALAGVVVMVAGIVYLAVTAEG